MSDWLLRQIEIGSEVSSTCALCGLFGHAARRYLEGVANDGVNNIPLRQRLTRKGGYCGRHCEVFLEEAHLLSSAILFEDFLERRLKNALAGRTTRITCEACGAEADMRRAVRSSLKRGRRDTELLEVLEKNAPLPHTLGTRLRRAAQRGAGASHRATPRPARPARRGRPQTRLPL